MTPIRNALVRDCADRIQRVWVPARPLIVQPSGAGLRGQRALHWHLAEAQPAGRARPPTPGLPFDACHSLGWPDIACRTIRLASVGTPHRHVRRAKALGGPMTCCRVDDRHEHGVTSSSGCPALETVRGPRLAPSPRQGRAPSRPGRSECRRSMRSRCDSRMQRQDRSSACSRFAPVA